MIYYEIIYSSLIDCLNLYKNKKMTNKKQYNKLKNLYINFSDIAQRLIFS